MDLNNNYFRVNQIKNENENEAEEDEVFDLETQSTFAAQMRENDFFDQINPRNLHSLQRYSKEEFDMYQQRLNNAAHFSFPDRSIKKFDQLDAEYYENTQQPDKRFEHIAEKKYQKLVNVYKFPYQTVSEQNRRIQQTPQPPTLRIENVSGPYNDYWVSDNDMKDDNNAYRFRIDNAILDPSKKKLYFQKYV